MKMEATPEKTDFLRALQAMTDEDVMLCDLCQACTQACPAAYAMAMKPHEMMRAIQLGEVEQIAWSGAPWLCLSCEACNVRCPRNINILRLLNALKEMSRRHDFFNPEAATASMNQIFLYLVERWGRVHLLPLLVLTHLKMLTPFKDIEFMSPLLRKRKIRVIPRKRGGAQELRRILSRIRALEQEGGTREG